MSDPPVQVVRHESESNFTSALAAHSSTSPPLRGLSRRGRVKGVAALVGQTGAARSGHAN
jgi:hypothetical protein